jgi:hypothetical protein
MFFIKVGKQGDKTDKHSIKPSVQAIKIDNPAIKNSKLLIEIHHT